LKDFKDSTLAQKIKRVRAVLNDEVRCWLIQHEGGGFCEVSNIEGTTVYIRYTSIRCCGIKTIEPDIQNIIKNFVSSSITVKIV